MLSRSMITPMHWRSLSYISTSTTQTKTVSRSIGVNRFETPQAPRACSPQFDWTFAEENVEEVGDKLNLATELAVK